MMELVGKLEELLAHEIEEERLAAERRPHEARLFAALDKFERQWRDQEGCGAGMLDELAAAWRAARGPRA